MCYTRSPLLFVFMLLGSLTRLWRPLAPAVGILGATYACDYRPPATRAFAVAAPVWGVRCVGAGGEDRKWANFALDVIASGQLDAGEYAC